MKPASPGPGASSDSWKWVKTSKQSRHMPALISRIFTLLHWVGSAEWLSLQWGDYWKEFRKGMLIAKAVVWNKEEGIDPKNG